jgi:hypothetical protein
MSRETISDDGGPNPNLHPDNVAIPLEEFATVMMNCPSAELADIDAYITALNDGFRTNPGRENAPDVIIREGQFIYCASGPSHLKSRV